VQSHRFLGVILDQGLKGNCHLNYLIEKGRKISAIISFLSGVVWGSHPGLLLTTYRAIFRSAVEYGCQFFTWKSSLVNFIKLLRIQYKVIRIAMGYRISISINVMLAEAKEIGLNIRFNLTTSKFLFKSMANKFSLSYRSLENMEIVATRKNRRIDAINDSRMFKLYVTSRVEKHIVYRSTYPPAFWHSYEVFSLEIAYINNLKGCDKKDNHQLIIADFYHKSFDYRQDATSWYTDGSKDQECAVGAAVFSPDLNGSVIFSDSESALEALSNSVKLHRNYIIYYIKAYLSATKQDHEIIFYWVPAHVGIPGNESADQAAKSAASEGFRTPFRVPYEDLLAEFTKRAKSQAKDNMKLILRSKCTLYYDNFYNNSTNKTWFH
ncbi:hypothetical protein ALC62_11049, partial [Cyphomyrmex costatus]